MKPEETVTVEKNDGLVNPPTDTTTSTIPEEETELTLVLSQDGIINLQSAAKWAKFIAIFTIISLVFLIFNGVQSIYEGSRMLYYGSRVIAVGFVYIVVAAISFIPTISLLKFANYAKEATQSLDGDALQLSMDRLRFTFKFQGIMLIVYLVIVVLAILSFILNAL
ncbi:MAG: DUF5362 family protein [Bacteroidaceae bacterium]|nr:DUF5362 family protein [Bacteroidaceae bacterium]